MNSDENRKVSSQDARKSDGSALAGQALVLGGGGVAGIAWMTGLLLGLQERGSDPVHQSDVLIGTSAGSTVAAQVACGTPLDDLFQRQIDPARQVKELVPSSELLGLVAKVLPDLLRLADPVERTRQVGQFAATSNTIPEAERRKVIAARLPSHVWPARTLKIVAIDIATGQANVFDKHSAVDLVDAVAASCAVPGLWPPVTFAQKRYMDGGIRSSDNVDIASGCKDIIVISPMGKGEAMREHHVETLQAQGARVVILEPDAESIKAIRRNPLAPEVRIPAAHAGRAQGRKITSLVS